MRNESGKALTIFLVLIAIILVSLTAISVFLLIKQVQLRENAEYNLAQLKTSESALRAEFDEMKKQKGLLEKKEKEAESKIENLVEELDLAQGVRDEVKKENRDLKDKVDALTKQNTDMTNQMEENGKAAQEQADALQTKLDDALKRNQALEDERKKIEAEYNALKQKLSSPQEAPASGESAKKTDVNLDKIVVSSNAKNEGQIVSIDKDAEFVIVNLGEHQGIKVNSVLSVFNGKKYLGDVVVTKVLPEMSAADFIAPLTSQQVSEGNSVKLKK